MFLSLNKFIFYLEKNGAKEEAKRARVATAVITVQILRCLLVRVIFDSPVCMFAKFEDIVFYFYPTLI